MLKKLFKSLDRYRVIMDRQDNEPYLERYYFFLKDRDRFPFNIFVHKFLKSDPDAPHDHPWPYFTLILTGGYWEWIPQFDERGRMTCEIGKWRGPGHFRFCRATSYHRIEVDPTVSTYTLFVPGPKQREWGFLKRVGRVLKWIPHEQYLNNPKG